MHAHCAVISVVEQASGQSHGPFFTLVLLLHLLLSSIVKSQHAQDTT